MEMLKKAFHFTNQYLVESSQKLCVFKDLASPGFPVSEKEEIKLCISALPIVK